MGQTAVCRRVALRTGIRGAHLCPAGRRQATASISGSDHDPARDPGNEPSSPWTAKTCVAHDSLKGEHRRSEHAGDALFAGNSTAPHSLPNVSAESDDESDRTTTLRAILQRPGEPRSRPPVRECSLAANKDGSSEFKEEFQRWDHLAFSTISPA